MFALGDSAVKLEEAAAKRRRVLREKKAKEKRVREQVARNAAAIQEAIVAQAEERRSVAAAAAAAPPLPPAVSFREVYRAVGRAACKTVGNGFDDDGDRVLLPISALKKLEGERALGSGAGGIPMAFELSTREGGKTHAGVLEFSAPEGTICLPRKVADCLGAVIDGDSDDGFVQRVVVKYVALPKGTSVTLQPRGSSFVDDVSADWRGVKGVLEASMRAHSTLSVGDWLTVEHAGRRHDVDVVALEPADAVSTIDTDIECILAESLADASARALAEAAEAAAASAAEERAASAVRDAAARTAARTAAAAVLRDEPPDGAPDVVECSLRLPAGARATRRFRLDEPLVGLFHFVDSLDDAPSGDFRIVRRMPRRVVGREEATEGERRSLSFTAGGFVAGREALIVEAVNVDG